MMICPFTKTPAVVAEDGSVSYVFETATYRYDPATLAEISRVPPSMNEQTVIQTKLRQYVGPVATIANSREKFFRFKVV